VQASVGAAFYAFIIFTSNPFVRIPNPPFDGRDLNPLLQDPGLAFHPPFLYLGYVGLSMAFSFAVAALIEGRVDAAWARWVRPWTLAAWVFLTIGIALGSWWAYYELGWGGWWFWDPVENASFMPWLVGTALIHSLAVTEKRGVFKNWTVLLAIAAFSLSLLGAFLVRSGVLTSVHAFAADPDRGIFLLIYLLIVVAASLILFVIRAPEVKGKVGFGFWSKETLLLINNIILVVATAMVLLGTLYPLVLDSLTGAKLSVGPPYFNTLFVPLMGLLMLAMGAGIITRWKNTPAKWLIGMLGPVLVLSAVLSGIGSVVYRDFNSAVLALFFVCAWVVLASVRDILDKTRHRGLWRGIRKLQRSYWGMHLGHLGMVFMAVGVVLSSQYSDELDLKMSPGDSVELSGYRFQFEGAEHYEGPNYISDKGNIRVFSGEREMTLLQPEKRLYIVQQMPMTEAAIDPGFTRDLYVAMGEPLDDGAWAIRIHSKPFVRWIWIGGFLTAFGGVLSAMDRRYRVKVKKKVKDALGMAEQENTAHV